MIRPGEVAQSNVDSVTMLTSWRDADPALFASVFAEVCHDPRRLRLATLAVVALADALLNRLAEATGDTSPEDLLRGIAVLLAKP